MNNPQKLWSLARSVLANAYCPYSHFPVAAAVLSAEGRFYTGCNVENVSFPNGTCAETGAIAAMVNGGDRKIAEILILAAGKNLITPCGACRQRIAEFALPQTLVHLADSSGVQKTLGIAELLPFAFNDESLTDER